MENTTNFLQNRLDSERCGKDWLCSQSLVTSLAPTKFYKSQRQYFQTENIPLLEATLLCWICPAKEDTPYQSEKVRENSRECHNHKPQPFPDTKRKRKPTNPNKHKPNKRTKSTKISTLFPKRGNHNTKRTEKHKNKMTDGKTYNKSPRRINHKATKSKTNTRTTALERSRSLET